MKISHWKWDCLKIHPHHQSLVLLERQGDHSENSVITQKSLTSLAPTLLQTCYRYSDVVASFISNFPVTRKPHMKMGPTQSHPALLQPIWNHHAATVKTGTMQKLYIFGIVHYFPFTSLPLDFWLVCPLILTILSLDFDQFVLRFFKHLPFFYLIFVGEFPM